MPYNKRVFAALSGLAPTIHLSTGTVSLLDPIAASGCEVVSVDWRLPLDEAWSRLGPDLGIQGNLDPTLCLAPWPAVAAGARDVLRRPGGRPGHGFNLGHGILPETPIAHVERMIARVRAS